MAVIETNQNIVSAKNVKFADGEGQVLWTSAVRPDGLAQREPVMPGWEVSQFGLLQPNGAKKESGWVDHKGIFQPQTTADRVGHIEPNAKNPWHPSMEVDRDRVDAIDSRDVLKTFIDEKLPTSDQVGVKVWDLSDPEQIDPFINHARESVRSMPYERIQLISKEEAKKFGLKEAVYIRKYSITKGQESLPTALALDPHSDDFPICGGALSQELQNENLMKAKFGMSAHAVDVLQVTCGTTGKGKLLHKDSRKVDGQDMQYVRAYEDLLAGQALGIRNLWIPEFENAAYEDGVQIGFHEYGMNGWNENQLKMFALYLRSLPMEKTPSIIILPHEKDGHVDHQVVSRFEDMLRGPGGSASNYPEVPGSMSVQMVMRYATWAEDEIPSKDHLLKYSLNSRTLKRVIASLMGYASQNHQQYLKGKLFRDLGIGGFTNAGNRKPVTEPYEAWEIRRGTIVAEAP